MTFEEAEKELAEIAKGEYHSLRYKRTTTGHGDVEAECSVYVDGVNWYSSNTWRSVLDILKKEMSVKMSIDKTEAPA